MNILEKGDKINHYFMNSEWYIRSQGGPVIAAALKGMVVVSAYESLSNSESVVNRFMEINLNSLCHDAILSWDNKIIDA